MRPLIVVAGPTACGKSDAAQAVCLALQGEVVSADAFAVYRGMDVGTAKTPPEERLVPHHMIDVADPRQGYDVARYQAAAREVIADIHGRGRLPVLVGGTGLFIDAVLYPMDFSGASSDPGVRARWAQYLEEKGPAALHEALAAVDPASAARLPEGDVRRVLRALEVHELSGAPMSAGLRDYRSAPRYDALYMVLIRPRAELCGRIDGRVDEMMRRGLLEEIRALLGGGVSPDARAMQAIGYKELAGHILQGAPLDGCVAAVKLATRRYAKRQMTWFRRAGSIFLTPDDDPVALARAWMAGRSGAG